MKRIINSLLVLMLFCASAATMAQNTITLQESKKQALAYSKAIKNGDIRIEQAESMRKEALSHYFPSISATGAVVYGFDDIISEMPGLVPVGIDNIYVASATANEVVYAGGKIKKSNDLALLQSDVYTLRASQSRDSVLLLTEQKFWNIVALQEQMKVLKSTQKYLDELLKQQQDLINAGLIARNDLLKVKVEKSRLLLNKSKLNNGRKLALLDFALYTGMSYDTTLVAQADFTNIEDPNLKYVSVDTVVTSNSNYKLMEKSLEAQELQTKLTKADLLPTFTVGLAGTQFGSFDNSLNSRFVPVAMGTLSIPISDWWGAGKQKVKQKELDVAIVKNNLEDVKDKLQLAIMQSWYNVTDAYEQIQFATINNDQATENLEVNTDNYAAGLSGLTDLLDAQRIQQQAASDLVRAYANFKDKEAMYLYRTDSLKEN